jgi:hypothetical protein
LASNVHYLCVRELSAKTQKRVREGKMSKYILCDWEINGYDDSDFMLMYYDDVSNTLHSHMHGTTRFGGCLCHKEGKLPEAPQGSSGYHLCARPVYTEGTYERVGEIPGEWFLSPTVEVVEAARKLLEEKAFQGLTIVDKRLRDEPGPEDLVKGMTLRLTAAVRNQVSLTEPCRKCAGTGKWENPRNSADKRECFACRGTGTHKVGKVKTEAGKLKYDTIPADTVGMVVDWGSFGTFYRNGYNQPNRENTSVQLRIQVPEGDKVVRATLAKCRMERDYSSPESLRKRAVELSYNYHWPAGTGAKCAWLTRNFGAEVVAAATKAQAVG